MEPIPRCVDVTDTGGLRLSVSRLNHWLPRMQAHPEVVQGTSEFHHQIADARLPQADAVFHDAAALAPARGTGSLCNRRWWRSWFATCCCVSSCGKSG